MATIPLCKVKARIIITLLKFNGSEVMTLPTHESVVQPEPYYFDSPMLLRLRIRQLAEMAALRSAMSALEKGGFSSFVLSGELDVRVDDFRYELLS